MRNRIAARSATRALAGALFALVASSAPGCAGGKSVEPASETFERIAMAEPEHVFVFEFDRSSGETSAEAGALADEVVSRLAEIPIPGLHVKRNTPLLGPALGVDGSFLALDTGVVDHLRAEVRIQTLEGGFFDTVHRFETEASGRDRVERTAHEIAREVARFYASQGWLDPAHVPE
jgi:hypothetical protein